MKSLLCNLGIHDWELLPYTESERICLRCQEYQIRVYNKMQVSTRWIRYDDLKTQTARREARRTLAQNIYNENHAVQKEWS